MASAADAPQTADGTPLAEYDKPVNNFVEGTWLHDEVGKRYEQNRDLVFIVDDIYAERGTGKTTLSMTLAEMLDRTPEGVTWEKCIIDPAELGNAYWELPKGSALVLDEAEIGVSSRDPMTATNKYVREMMGIARRQEKYVIINCPFKSMLDRDIRMMAAAWLSVERRGLARVHHMKPLRYANKAEPNTPFKQWFGWEPIAPGTDLHRVYQKLSAEKDKYTSGEKGDGYIRKSEHQEEMRKLRESMERDVRNETMARILSHAEHDESDDISQRSVGESVGLSQQHVGRVVREWQGEDAE